MLVVGVIAAGAFLGINNTLITEAVMLAAPVERGTASAAYSFVRFGGGAVAPWLAGKLGESVSPHLPFWVGAAATALGVVVLSTGRRVLAHVDEHEPAAAQPRRGRGALRRRRLTPPPPARDHARQRTRPALACMITPVGWAGVHDHAGGVGWRA